MANDGKKVAVENAFCVTATLNTETVLATSGYTLKDITGLKNYRRRRSVSSRSKTHQAQYDCNEVLSFLNHFS